jgi:hypothetical protein
VGTDRVTEFVYVLPLGEFEKVLYCLACPHTHLLLFLALPDEILAPFITEIEHFEGVMDHRLLYFIVERTISRKRGGTVYLQ